MSKRHHRKRIIVGRMKTIDLWFSREELCHDPQYQLLEKLYTPQGAEEALQGLVDLGLFDTRVNLQGIQEFRINRATLAQKLAELPPEACNDPREIRIYEHIAAICGYDPDASTLLTVIIQQSEQASRDPLHPIPPWIGKTKAELDHDTMGIVKDLATAFKKLIDHEYIISHASGPDRFVYALNGAAVQAAIDRNGVRG